LPAIEAGEISLIVEATPQDLARAQRTHAGFVQALRLLAIEPLAPAAARAALVQAVARVARARRTRIEDAALERALDLSERFGEGVLPAGAIELLRGAAAPREPAVAGGGSMRVGADEVMATFCARTGYPRDLIDPGRELHPDRVHEFFASRVLGQDAATEVCTRLGGTPKAELV